MEYEKNPDGTDKLDENGNPIPVEIANTESEADKLVKTQLVQEIKDLREKNALQKALLDATKGEPETPKPAEALTDDDKIAAAVEKILQQKQSSDAKANKTAAFEKFIATNKEFHPENDELGLKSAALLKKFNQFNTEGLVTIDEFLVVIGDAKRLLVSNDSPQDPSKDTKTPYPNSTPRGTQQGREESKLSPKEKKLAETTGRTEEQILKMRQKHPDFLESLLEHIRD